VTASAERASPTRRYPRGSDEFGRVLSFSDGLFAIAMTLLVVGIVVPEIADPDSIGDLADALNDLSDSIVSFVISFAVIGRYWIAHHQMFSLLGAMDRGLITLNLVYLGIVAFLPFPTALLGNFFDNPLAFTVYAVTIAAVSGMEVVLLRHAHRAGLLSRPMPEEVFRFGALMSLSPVVFFLASIPVAFWSSEVAVVMWFLGIPLGIWGNRRAPAGAAEYFDY
jgi:uncharacterized membrane protein